MIKTDRIRNQAKVLLFFFVIANAGLWGGSYLLSTSPDDAWYNFPVFFTALIMGVLGSAGAIGSCMVLYELKDD